ncbi:metal-dependent transcriptional regulator [Elusimicrobiota bacterium]
MNKYEIDEHLETLWHLFENNELDMENFKSHMENDFNETIVKDFQDKGLIKISQDQIKLLDAGKDTARRIVRSHRLAERLQRDILGMSAEETERAACEFEHVLAPEIVNSICTLLGHPRECPHGRHIPEGKCCREKTNVVSSAVLSLDKAQVGKEYKIAYVYAASHSRMHKFAHFGIVPGAQVTLHQNSPAFVARTESGQIAMDKALAGEIYVWKK